MHGPARNRRFPLSALIAVCWLLCGVPFSRADDGLVKDAAAGCAVFKPNLRLGEVVVWKGACANGHAEGNGVARWSANDGTTVTFEGRFAQGKLQGVGTMSASGGDRYEGSYRDGRREGRGVYVSANGDRYEGEYKENQRHGQGSLVLATGNRVVGEWRNGVQIATKSDAAPPPAVAANPIVSQPQPQPAQAQDRQMQIAQRVAQQQAIQEQRDQKRAEQQHLQQLATQQRAEERERQQQAAQQVAEEQQRQTQLAQAAAQEERRQRQVVQQLAREQQTRQELIVLWALLIFPIAAGALVTMFKSSTAVSASNKVGQWIGSRQERATEKTGLFADFFLRPVLWCFQKLFAITASIASPFLQAGVRIATWLYLVGAILFLIYWVTVIVLAIAMLVAGFWLLGVFLGDVASSSSSSSSSSRQRADSRPYLGGTGESRLREGLTGQYVEHTDAAGNVVSRSRQREGLTGRYVEHEDVAGNVIAESRNREGLTGDYVEHQNAAGDAVGESRRREGLLGPYTEHQNADGKVVGESREREGLLGRYTEHKKSR
jgi:hypothetical protein